MSFNAKNYKENGDKLIIGGILELKDQATLISFPNAENQENSVATTVADLKNDFNSLIEKFSLMESH